MQTQPRVSSLAGWAVLAALFAATTCVESMSWNQLTAYTPLYLRELHFPASKLPRWIAAISSLGWIIALRLAPFRGAPQPIVFAIAAVLSLAPLIVVLTLARGAPRARAA